MAPLPAFDSNRDFIVKRQDLIASGRRYDRDEPFDKGSVEYRVLRNLYNARQIAFADMAEGPKIDPVGGRQMKLYSPEETESDVDRLVKENSKKDLLALQADEVKDHPVDQSLNKHQIAAIIVGARQKKEATR